LNKPTSKDIQITKKLLAALHNANQFEPENDALIREVVLGKLNDILKTFVYNISIKRMMPDAIAAEAGGKIFTFGSYRLGVHGKGADIDTLCVVPKHVTREDFFSEMYETLCKRPEVSEITSVEDAYVPVIKMEFSSIPIDLVFAKLNLPSVPEDLELSDDNLLKGLDDRCVRSLNGSRVTDEILRLVPNIEEFRIALRTIKLWAKRRAIYSNVMGFFGGVAWAMVVARVAQLYPNAAAATIVSKFFSIIKQWRWPDPILLKQIDDGPLPIRVWNPKLYPADKLHKMPIITPAYPSMCATHNVTESTKAVMIQEFERADEISNRVISTGKWDELFEPSDFFEKYSLYLLVIASSADRDLQLKWSGMVESRLRQLISRLESVSTVDLAHPFIKGFEKCVECNNQTEADNVANGIPLAAEDTRSALKTGDEPIAVHMTSLYVGLKINSKKLDIAWPCNDYLAMVRNWDLYDATKMNISLTYLKSKDLPDEVFGDNPRPVKKKSKKRKTLNSDEVLPAVKKLKSETIVAEDPETPLAESNELIPDYAIVEPEEKTSEA